jgi:hypothetical protein
MRGYAVAMGSARALERYAWIGGVLYVVALITEAVILARLQDQPRRLGRKDRQLA